MATADPGEPAGAGRNRRRPGDFLWALGVHALASIVYGAIAFFLVAVSDWNLFAPNSTSSDFAVLVAGWLFLAGGFVWLVRLVNMTRWWLQGRHGLLRPTIVFDSLLWLGPWVAILLPWQRTRRLLVPASQPRAAGRARRTRRLAVALGVLAIAGVGVGWVVEQLTRPNPRLAHVSAVAGRSLGHRSVAFSFGSPDYRDVWVLSGGRLRRISRGVRIATGGQCYGDPGYGGSSGPCYELAEPLSVSRDGRYVAYFLQDTVGAPDTSWPALIVSRADGSGARRVADKLSICPVCSLSPPSWDPDGRSFVISAPIALPKWAHEDNLDDFDEDTVIFRVERASGRAVPLTDPARRDTYNDAFPTVSPDGRRIAFLRSVAAEPSDDWSEGVVADIDVMGAHGGKLTRVPLPARYYSRLWWCGTAALCATTPRAASAGFTYRIDLRDRVVTRLRRWPEAATAALSTGAAFALEERRTGPHRFEVLAGPVGGNGRPRLESILVSADADGNPFGDFSVSGP